MSIPGQLPPVSSLMCTDETLDDYSDTVFVKNIEEVEQQFQTVQANTLSQQPSSISPEKAPMEMKVLTEKHPKDLDKLIRRKNFFCSASRKYRRLVDRDLLLADVNPHKQEAYHSRAKKYYRVSLKMDIAVDKLESKILDNYPD